MRIILDLRIFGVEYGGLGRYNQKLLEYLMQIDKSNQYILLFKTRPDNLILPDNFKIKICNFHWYSFQEQLRLPFILKKLKPDLVHFPHFNVPLFYRGRFVLTIHDLIMTKYPSQKASTLNKLFFVIKRWGYQITIKSAVRRAAKIIAVSKFTAQDIKNYFSPKASQPPLGSESRGRGLADKISVIYEGVSEARDPEEVSGLPDKFLFYVGNAYPHKNLAFLLTVFEEFKKSHPDFYLILAGQTSYFYERLKKQAGSHVIFTGLLSDAQLAWYYQKATAYIFPSLYEGFGLPPLEAMSYHLPVLSSHSSCLPEVLGNAALYFDPQNLQDCLDKLEQIINNKDLRQKLIIAGGTQIKKYDWQKMASATFEIYKNLL